MRFPGLLYLRGIAEDRLHAELAAADTVLAEAAASWADRVGELAVEIETAVAGPPR